MGDQWNFVLNINISNYLPNQNYPTTFNSSTKISFSIPTSEHIKLEVFITVEAKVKTLDNELKSAGNYSYGFNAVNLASGVYYYRLSADNFSEIKK